MAAVPLRNHRAPVQAGGYPGSGSTSGALIQTYMRTVDVISRAPEISAKFLPCTPQGVAMAVTSGITRCKHVNGQKTAQHFLSCASQYPRRLRTPRETPLEEGICSSSSSCSRFRHCQPVMFYVTEIRPGDFALPKYGSNPFLKGGHWQ